MEGSRRKQVSGKAALMSGTELRALREALGETQDGMAERLNRALGRSYDRHRVSGWETGLTRIPAAVVLVLRTITGRSA